jgi:hypothetical protein
MSGRVISRHRRRISECPLYRGWQKLTLCPVPATSPQAPRARVRTMTSEYKLSAVVMGCALFLGGITRPVCDVHHRADKWHRVTMLLGPWAVPLCPRTVFLPLAQPSAGLFFRAKQDVMAKPKHPPGPPMTLKIVLASLFVVAVDPAVAQNRGKVTSDGILIEVVMTPTRISRWLWFTTTPTPAHSTRPSLANGRARLIAARPDINWGAPAA